jgi:hypothetical protein
MDGDKRRINLVIRSLDMDGGPPTVLLFMEAKEKRPGPTNVDECERQALTACWEYIQSKEMGSV